MAASCVAHVSLVILCILTIEIAGRIIDQSGTKAKIKQKASSLKCQWCGPDRGPCDGRNVTTVECKGFQDRCMSFDGGHKALVAKYCANSTLDCQEENNPCKPYTSMGLPCNFECCEGNLCNQASPGEVNTTAGNSTTEVPASFLKCEAACRIDGEPCGEGNVTSVECEGWNDRCMTISITFQSKSIILKRCANSTLNCQQKSQYNPCKELVSKGTPCDFECCEGDLCNQVSPGEVNTTASNSTTDILEISGGTMDLNGTKAQIKQEASSLKCQWCGPDRGPCDGSNVTTVECEGFQDRCLTFDGGHKALVAKYCANSTLDCQEENNPCKPYTSMGLPCNFECCEGDLCNQASPGEVNTIVSNPTKPEVAAGGVQCPVCTNLPGFPGAKKCEEADIVTCEPADVMNRCMTIDAVIMTSYSGVATMPFQLKNCSNSFMCDPGNDFNMCNTLNMTGLVTSCSFSCTTPSSNVHAWNLGGLLGLRGIPNTNDRIKGKIANGRTKNPIHSPRQ